MTGGFLAGLALGFALIGPIGPQNLYVIRAGLALPPFRALVVMLAAALCDALLITLGAAGAGALVTGVPGVHAALLAGGCLFLLYLGGQALRAPQPDLEPPEGDGNGTTLVMARNTVGVSLLNPHAILDTTVVIGATAAAQHVGARPAFALGAISASLLWFLLIGFGANALRRRLTPAIAQYIERISGVVLLAFAVKLAFDFIRHWI